MRRAGVGSSYATPLRVIPERGQVIGDIGEATSKESCHVLHEDVSRSKYANDTSELGP
jgi:hypothetical protein